MYKDFEGKTEEEAREAAVEELGLNGVDFDVEVVECVKKGLFKKPYCKIRVYYGDEDDKERTTAAEENRNDESLQILEAENDTERKVLEFVNTLIEKMGYEGNATISYRSESKVGLDIDSPDSSYIIGRKGRNLDAIQLITNVYAGNLDPDIKIVVDSENYRMRHEEQIIRNAYKVAEIVKKSGRSRLLDPMNPFERRLVHTALNEVDGVETKSEGEGLYKQVRVLPVKK